MHEERQVERRKVFPLLVLDHLVVGVGAVVDESRDVGLAGKPRRPQGAWPRSSGSSDRRPPDGAVPRRAGARRARGSSPPARELLLVELLARLIRVLVDRIGEEQHRRADQQSAGVLSRSQRLEHHGSRAAALEGLRHPGERCRPACGPILGRSPSRSRAPPSSSPPRARRPRPGPRRSRIASGIMRCRRIVAQLDQERHVAM